MMTFFTFMFSGFWTFVGMSMVLSFFANILFRIYLRFLRHFILRKHGYPPPHCDADGDFKKIKKAKTSSDN